MLAEMQKKLSGYRFKYFFVLLIITGLYSCKQAPILGLWQVEEVKVDEEVMTPVARWMRFNGDYTQTSGNGWLQHSEGTWSYDNFDSTLVIKNANGYKDPYEPFKVRFEDSNMIWERTEEGSDVQIKLKSIKKLPKSDANSLLGVWQLQNVKENDKDISWLYNTGEDNYLFIKWDNAFVIQTQLPERQSGIYRTHGHQPQVEFVYNTPDCKREYWVFEVNNNQMSLTSTANDTTLVKNYNRIDFFPE